MNLNKLKILKKPIMSEKKKKKKKKKRQIKKVKN